MSTKLAQNDRAIHTLDLNFMNIPGSIAVYLLPHAHGAALIECGPGSTIASLLAGLKMYGLQAKDITDVFVTHVHLDHAGAAGWLASQGARIHVHLAGATHLLDPERLLSSAARIYGDMMDTLWGQFLPVPEERLSVLQDGEAIEIDGLRVQALDTPGHAKHHNAYLSRGVCFSGDIGGVRLGGTSHLRLPMPPPDIHLETWRQSIQRFQAEYDRGSFTRIAPTHFGIYDDAAWHLAKVLEELSAVEQWIETVMPTDPSIEQLNDQFLAWQQERSRKHGMKPALAEAYETANPSTMSPYGLQRYWRKHRA